MNLILLQLAAAALAASAMGGTAMGGETVEWEFLRGTSGQDVRWTSPAAVDVGARRYDVSYELTEFRITVRWQGELWRIEQLDELPEELRTRAVTTDDPPPIVLFDERIIHPEPPDDPGFEGDLLIQITDDGHGRFDLTDVWFGTVFVEIPPFGTQEVTLTNVRVGGRVTVTTTGHVPDINHDGLVDVQDLLILLASWGACDPCEADLNGDGVVDVSDLLELLAAWGP